MSFNKAHKLENKRAVIYIYIIQVKKGNDIKFKVADTVRRYKLKTFSIKINVKKFTNFV